MIRYSKEHEWVRLEGTTATIGISDFAQSELGDITFVELPEVGAEFAKDDVLCVVESVKAASDIFAPVSGTVASVNTSLEDSPETVNSSAEDDGWICTIEGVDPIELDDLLDAAAYRDFCSS